MLEKEEFIKKMLKAVLVRPGLRDKSITHPFREWYLGLFISVIMLVASSIWGLQLYQTYKESDADTDTEKVIEKTIYRDNMVKEALEIYNQREAVLEELAKTTPAPTAMEREQAEPKPAIIQIDAVETDQITDSNNASSTEEAEEMGGITNETFGSDE